MLSDSRAVASALKVGATVTNDSPASILNGLAVVPPASRFQVTRKWVREAAALAGVAPTDTELLLTDATTAQEIGSTLHQVEAQLASADPVSEGAADLHTQKQELIADLAAVASSSPNPAVVLSTAVAKASQSVDYATATAKAQRLSPAQEKAMMARGKVLIAAGAGSGKTSVLASKVVYHINELGVPPSAVIATSFSRKSAAELRRRIEKYGASIPNSAETGFGTTHSIAGKLMREYGQGGREGLKSYEQTNLVRLAMEQVQMVGAGGQTPPEPTSLFGGPPAPGKGEASLATNLTFRQACELAYDRRGKLNLFQKSFIESFFNTSDQWHRLTMQKTNNLRDPRGLTDKQSAILKDIFARTGIDYRVATDPLLTPQSKTAASVMAVSSPKKKSVGLADKFQFYSRPANQWFHLGIDLTEEGPDGQRRPIPMGVFKQAITKYKGAAISPSEAYAISPSNEAAVYAAYEWLKGPNGEVDFQGKGDFDDILLDVSKMLVSNPRVLRQVQSRFKTILVDESQDQNRAQHIMFGLISGFLDPAKVPNVAKAKKIGELANDNGNMTAETYAFVGDDKQAIYSFRGADPDAFIDMSDLVEGGAGFKTHVLTTNYRSGELIVEAANRLIAYNTRQIPMTCNPNPDRVDKGGIEVVRFEPTEGRNMKGPAAWLATQIAEDMEAGRAGPKGYDSYGVGLRSNAEAYAYGLELLKRGIPFRSKANFFNDPNTKALLYWLTIADEGLTGNADRVNEAVLGARSAPATRLGAKFEEKLTERASGNYLVWLQDNWQRIYGSEGPWADLVYAYVQNLLRIANMQGQPAEAVMNEVLTLSGFDGRSVTDVLIDKVREDDEALAELRAESADGTVTEEAIMEMAFAPIEPLKGLLGARPDLAEAMKYTRQLQAANQKLSTPDDPDAKGFLEPAVTLGTMHSWKGLEVPTMYVPLVGGRFPRSDASEEDLAAERRLAYVAITRGENQVVVMDIPTARQTKQGTVIQNSQFVGELCVPTRLATSGDRDDMDAEAEVMQGEMNRSAGVSPLSDEAINAYLQGQR